MKLESYIREFKDFPVEGIDFKDISPILQSPTAMSYIAGRFAEYFSNKPFDVIAGTESRGLIFASAFAMHMNKPFIMIRKRGKLPGSVEQVEYDLEYGENILEVQKDAIKPGQNVLIIDDLLATGGTAKASGDLIEKLGGNVVGFAFVIELAFLNGRKDLQGYDVYSLVSY